MDLIKLLVKINNKTTEINLSANDSIADIKSLIEEKEDIPSAELALYFKGHPLDDDECIVELNVNEGDVFDANVKLRGGKVHGSLARAGKVRGQTPKVEKQEKKKKKTGRAKRRIQYNRRFVNVVATFGRRRGPNTNQ